MFKTIKKWLKPGMKPEVKEKISIGISETRQRKSELERMRHLTEMARMKRELDDIREENFGNQGLTIEDVEDLLEDKFSDFEEDDGELNIAQIVQLLGKGGIPGINPQTQTTPYAPSFPPETPLFPVNADEVQIVVDNIPEDFKAVIQRMPKEKVTSLMGGVWEHLNTLKV